jgi:ABC-type phosphate/phosphonate transport system substrate-binding protein
MEQTRRGGGGGDMMSAPDHLLWPSSLESHWQEGASGGIFLTQTCGLPLVTTMSACLKAVAVPCYRVPGCHGSSYSSVIVVPSSSSLRSLDNVRLQHKDIVVAVNSTDSLSGCLALKATISHPLCNAAFEAHSRHRPGGSESSTAPVTFFKRINVTGSHAESLACVADSRAHLACIDCVTYALILQQQPDISRQIRIIARTPSAPSLPYCTSITTSDAACEALFQALEAAAVDPALQDVRDSLKITGFRRYECARLEGCAHDVMLCPYKVAVSRLFLRARGSGSVSMSVSSRTTFVT